ncbi:preprotein translocase subunit SecE [Tessaracoccus sp. HDW20]|nr:preprotein translocase subunit SecE [Tessaracoccus coleopterorum]
MRKKETRTRKRSEALEEHDDPYKASNPAEFIGQSAAELKRVVWPTWPQTVSMFTAVLTFVLIMIAIVGVLDFVFAWGLLKVFGSK